MAYTHVQFIAYEVPTGAALPAGDCDYKDLALVAGVKDDPVFEQAIEHLSPDARMRVFRMLGVIDLAMRTQGVVAGAQTLKLFAAPEFYFRPEADGSASRSYASSDLVAAIALFRLVFAQPKLQHWLFVPGTFVWNMKGKVLLGKAAKVDSEVTKYLETLEALAEEDFVYNTALVATGGGPLHLYDKIKYSPADEVAAWNRPTIKQSMPSADDDSASPFDHAADSNQEMRDAVYKYFEKANLKGANCLVPVDNLSCGVEVCLDHGSGVLKAAYGMYQRFFDSKKDPIRPLDFELLTACGMPVQTTSVPLAAGRYVFRVDGASWADPNVKRFDHSEIQKVVKAGKFNAAEMLSPATNEADWKKLNQPVAAVELQGDLALLLVGKTAQVYAPQAEGDDPLDQAGRVSRSLATSFLQRLVVYQRLEMSHLLA